MHTKTIFLWICFQAVQANKYVAIYQSHMDDKYQDTNYIEYHQGVRLVQCTRLCSYNKQCLSFFYNNGDEKCFLHSDPFTYTLTKMATGWKFYIFNEVSQRCKKGFFHYRALDLCYSFNPLIVADQENIMNACVGPGMEMIRIDSEEKQKYIQETLIDIGLVYSRPICIQGTRTIDPQNRWTFFDGTVMNYTNWYPGQPGIGSIGYAWIIRIYDYQWNIVDYAPFGTTCSYMCEYRA